MDESAKAAELLRQIVGYAGAALEDRDSRDLLARNEARLRAVFEEAERFHQAAGGGVAEGDLSDFLVQTAFHQIALTR